MVHRNEQDENKMRNAEVYRKVLLGDLIYDSEIGPHCFKCMQDPFYTPPPSLLQKVKFANLGIRYLYFFEHLTWFPSLAVWLIKNKYTGRDFVNFIIEKQKSEIALASELRRIIFGSGRIQKAEMKKTVLPPKDIIERDSIGLGRLFK